VSYCGALCVCTGVGFRSDSEAVSDDVDSRDDSVVLDGGWYDADDVPADDDSVLRVLMNEPIVVAVPAADREMSEVVKSRYSRELELADCWSLDMPGDMPGV
jgi:hypothetical protein